MATGEEIGEKETDVCVKNYETIVLASAHHGPTTSTMNSHIQHIFGFAYMQLPL
jgi:hypothetical protein